MTVTVDKVTDTVGAVISGVDEHALLNDPDLPHWILEQLEAHGALVFKELHLDDATQVAFSKRLGKVEIFKPDAENPEIFRVSLDPNVNRAADYLRGTFEWHIDGMTDDTPISATILSAHAIAAVGGETEFCSTYSAYDELTDEEKERFEAIRVIHTMEASQRTHIPNPTEAQLALWRSRPDKNHPLVWTHNSGRKSLVLGATASHLADLAEDEGHAFLTDLLAKVTVPHRVFRHTWSVGDLVIWDNRGVLHRACEYDPNSGRDMHRTTLTGDEAVK